MTEIAKRHPALALAALAAGLLLLLAGSAAVLLIGTTRTALAYPEGWTVQSKIEPLSGAIQGVSIHGHRGYRFAAWREDTDRVVFSRSGDGGATWEAPYYISRGFTCGDPVVIAGTSGAGPEGRDPFVWVFFECARGGGGYRQIWIAKSSDLGATFPFDDMWWTTSHADKFNPRVDQFPNSHNIGWVHEEVCGGVREVKCGGCIGSPGGVINPYSNRWISPLDGVASFGPDIACDGTNRAYVVYTNNPVGSHTSAHIRYKYTADSGLSWGNPGVPSDVVACNSGYNQSHPRIEWTGSNPYFYCNMERKSDGSWYVGRYYFSTHWYPSTVAEATVASNGGAMPNAVGGGGDGSGHECAFWRNSGNNLTFHVRNTSTAGDFFGDTAFGGNPNRIDCNQGEALYSGGHMWAAAARSDGIYFRGQDRQGPDVAITAPTGDGEIYVNGDFTVEAYAVDGFRVTGTDIATGARYFNGVEKVEYFYYDGISDRPLPTTGGGNTSYLPPYRVNARSDALNGKKFKILARGYDSAGNTTDCWTPLWVNVDLDEPVADIRFSGRKGSGGWYRSRVEVTLSGDDPSTDRVQYRVAGKDGRPGARWTEYETPFTVGEGRWEIEARCRDAAGNWSDTATRDLRVDRTPPVPVVQRPAKDTIQTGWTSEESFRVTGSATDENGISRLGIYIDGEKKSESGSNFHQAFIWGLSGVEEGNHTIEIRATDSAGNTARCRKNVFVGNVARDFFFPEGNTLPEFDQYICVCNPGDTGARVELEFMLENGELLRAHRDLAPKQRETVRVKDHVPENHHVSTHVHCPDKAIVAECPMYFMYRGVWKGGHNVMGINVLQYEWYFAEGTTRANERDGFFEPWYCVQNPAADRTANVTVTYMLESGQNLDRLYRVPPHSRLTIDVAADVGAGHDVSARLVSDTPVAAVRPQYFDYHGFAVDGSAVVGATSPATEWYFAEGCTHPGFQEWLTVQNPNDVEAEIKMTYMTGTGRRLEVAEKVPPRARSTFDVLKHVGDNQDVSATVLSSIPVVCERPQYYIYGMDEGKGWSGGEAAMGNPAPSTQYFLAEGTTITGFDTWYTLANPRCDEGCRVVIEYMFGDGSAMTQERWIEPHSRVTINVNDAVRRQVDVSGMISASFPIVIERPMYFQYNGVITGGHNACGYGVD